MTPTLPTLLIVDDEPLNRELLRRILYREYRILEAPDAEAALEELARAPVDILLCDQVMPGLSGTELAREVRRRFPATVSLLLTGYEDTPEIEEAQRDGVLAEVIGKPWAAPTLRAALGRAAARRVSGG
jgi:two-component system, NtrC family, response regulator HupR/HoxA